MSITSRLSAAAKADAAAAVPLRALAQLYATDRGVGKGHLQNLRTPLRWWRMLLLREATTADLSPDSIVALFKFCFRQGLARGTVERFRVQIRSLVRYAAGTGLIADAFETPAAIGRPATQNRFRKLAVHSPAGTLPHYYRHAWLTTAGAMLSKAVRDEYEAHLNHWLRFHDGADPNMADVGEGDLLRFREYLVAAGRSDRVAYRAVARLRALLRHAEPERWPLRYAHNKRADATAPAGSLRQFFEREYLGEHEIKESTRKFYEFVIARFRRHLAREPMLADLTDRVVNDFLATLAEEYSPSAARTYRNVVISIWKAAFQWELTDVQPRRVRRVKVPPPLPDAWTPEEAARLIEVAERLEGQVRGIPRRLLLRAWMLAQYDVGFRTSDMLALRQDDVDWRTGIVVIRQQKTGFPICRRFSPAALQAMLATLAFKPDRERLFPLASAGSRRPLYRAWRRLLESAGLPITRRNGPQKWRRTSATHLARTAGVDAASEHLGHHSPELALRHYLDASQAFAPPPLPPALPLKAEPAGLLEYHPAEAKAEAAR